MLFAAALGCVAGAATAQSPALTGPLRILVGFPPGAGIDLAARVVGEGLQKRLGIPVIVENPSGAGGRIAAQQAKTARPDQNVILLANPAQMLIAPLVFKDITYDPQKDFTPLSQVYEFEFAIAVGASIPVKDFNHLLEWLKSNPALANIGVPATGSLPHFFALMLAERSGVQAQVVGYRGSPPLNQDLVGGQIPVAVSVLDTLLPLHESGKIRILATSGSKRSHLAPSIPTLSEKGVELTALGWNTFFAPATMHPGHVELIAKLIPEIMSEPETKRRFSEAKMTPVVSSRAQTESMLQRYRAQWVPVVQRSGYQP